MAKQNNKPSTYVGIDGTLMLAKDRRWDIDEIITEKFDAEIFLSGLEMEDKTPLPDMLRTAIFTGFCMALDEFEMFIQAFSELPGMASYPNDGYPKKYLPIREDGSNV